MGHPQKRWVDPEMPVSPPPIANKGGRAGIRGGSPTPDAHPGTPQPRARLTYLSSTCRLGEHLMASHVFQWT